MDSLLLPGLHLKVEVALAQQERVEWRQVDHNLIPQTQRPALMQEEAMGVGGLPKEGGIRETGSREPRFWSVSFPLPHGNSTSQGVNKDKIDAQNQAPKRPLLSAYNGVTYSYPWHWP